MPYPAICYIREKMSNHCLEMVNLKLNGTKKFEIVPKTLPNLSEKYVIASLEQCSNCMMMAK